MRPEALFATKYKDITHRDEGSGTDHCRGQRGRKHTSSGGKSPKAPKSNDLRGHSEFKLRAASEDPVFPAMPKFYIKSQLRINENYKA